ncbi:zinc-ribbon domain-containing protein [Halorubrum salinarum]|uniref:Zinc-ribbon domain-containing protein n=1 Tax=Halorubrum salinarum TaxID=2739057 RepID=A0A7D4BZD0_9EURY|nr:zinc ribbon domain-containing protein [Halorubrum salinarum]QKG94095.1 zinc-ribbon domain-containing protein [Halorubrum salinarum]
MTEKPDDKKYCRECGELIKQNSKFCPECGVAISEPNSTSRGTESGGSRSGTSNNTISQPTDPPSQGMSPSSASNNPEVNPTDVSTEPTTSDSWHYAVGLGLALWLGALILAGNAPAQLDFLVGLMGLVAWVLPPIAIYFDSQHLEYYTNWDPSAILWGIGSVIPLLNLIVMPVYLFRRHNVVN